jgi:acetyl esterase/lipase
VDVNPGGSTGYGRLPPASEWPVGVVDVQDCINAAIPGHEKGRWPASDVRRRVEVIPPGGPTARVLQPGRLRHRGREPFAVDTHKFESRYLDSLIGPYPEAKDLYRRRSPIHFVDQISCPVILFQGLEDKVVPPSQAEIMVRALEAKKLPYAYIAYEGEQHGFRKAENIQRSAEAELYFYGKVFGFDLGEPVEPVDIKNLK